MKGLKNNTAWMPTGVKRVLKNAYWRIYNVFLVNPAVPEMPRSFLFICMGNICRSPFAEHAARRYFPNKQEMTFSSAGIVVNHPGESPPDAVAAAKAFKIDLSEHRSQKVNEELVAASDMIFAMEAWHFRSLRKNFPHHREKVFLMAPFEKTAVVRHDLFDVLNIRDPYGRDLKEYESCFKRIDACLQGLFSLMQEAKER